ncbi:HNH endonuclease signature motif containing protein [Pseudidiomarina sp. CB1]|uniref:HNH endonuclease signature motif containing protein n=1 Tax=Pseudidiomarina sp. CB1 TaxID=2972484 RepID=UPI002161213E|nr:HNH endonuclease signature motif containing protein [Pseudidiomarina sp. CB1]
MKKLKISNYPSAKKIKELFTWCPEFGLQWKKDSGPFHTREAVMLYAEKDRLRLRYANKILGKVVQLNASAIVWCLNHGSLPSSDGIFSLNGDNTDFSKRNWAEQNLETIEIDGENIKEFVDYDEVTGQFVWKHRRPRNSNDRTFLRENAGKDVKYRLHDGYLTFKIANKERKAHQWAWLYLYGKFPPKGLVIDHIDRDKTNNSRDNLRAVTQAENCRNRAKYIPTAAPKNYRKKNEFPSTSAVRKTFIYDTIKGQLIWRKREERTASDKRFNNLFAGKRAGRYTGTEPVLINFNKSRYVGHELVWSYMGKPKPSNGLICLNGDKQDLRPNNWIPAEDCFDYFKSEYDPIKKQAILKRLLRYEPETGNFFHKRRQLRTKGDAVFNSKVDEDKPIGFQRNRYHYCCLLGRDYPSSHLAWLYNYGVWVPDTDLEIDHINLNSLDNRIDNLRLVTHQQNSSNLPLMKSNSSGCSGVMRDSQRKQRWRAFNRRKTLGVFETYEEAVAARKKSEIESF